jgi:spore maturation protein CgeB
LAIAAVMSEAPSCLPSRLISEASSSTSIVFVGHLGGTHIAASLQRAAEQLGIASMVISENLAHQGNRLWRAFNWRMRGRLGSSVAALSSAFRDQVMQMRPTHVIVTGISQLTKSDIQFAEQQGAKTVVFLTDDPWNPANASKRCLDAIAAYQVCLTPRSANLDQLKALNPNHVSYLPFAYDPELLDAQDATAPACDLMFVGGGDADRFAMLKPLRASGLKVAVYGGYWRTSEFPEFDLRGIQSPKTIVAATRSARLSLILVRRANRDQHTMRSFEAAASGGALLVEDTEDHRRIFGDSVAYFQDSNSLVRVAKALVDDLAACAQMREAVRQLMESGHHTYLHRLRQMLKLQP